MSSFKKVGLRWSLLSVAILGVFAFGAACVSSGDLDSIRTDAQVTLEGIQSDVQTLSDRVADLEENPTPSDGDGDSDGGSTLGNIGSPGGFLQRALAGEFRDTAEPVTVFGPCRDTCAQDYNAILAQFTEATGIPATYQGSAEFETEITTLVSAGTPPDIADFPQPGTVAGLVSDGELIRVTDYIDRSWLNSQYNDGWIEAGTFIGPDGEDFVAGVWSRTNAKSYVWYVPDNFEAAGYSVPTTYDELVALTNQIRNDGGTPWCAGIESGTATGWLATDWIEDLLLRTTSLENYDRWTVPSSADDRLRFDSPEVRRAIQLMADLWFPEGNVRGGRETIVATNFDGDARTQLFSDPPGCYMIRQAAFITGAWIDDDGRVPGDDFDAFYFPPVDAERGRPFISSGDLNVAFSDRPEVLALLEYHATPEFLDTFLQGGGDLSPFRSTTEEDYTSAIQLIAGRLLATSTAVRFDGSDLQPKDVGSGSFWSEITEYIAGNQDLDTTVKNIDATWPE